jgi:hypothetical protein
LVFLAFSTIF